MDIEESLVGAYLRHIRGCSVVVYNSFLTDQQGEVDVVGIEPMSTNDSKPPGQRTVWLCEVTTHISGLSPPVRAKAAKKLQRLQEFASMTFPGDEHRFEWWSPRVTPLGESQMSAAGEKAKAASGTAVEWVFNADYTRRVGELIAHAPTTSRPTASRPTECSRYSGASSPLAPTS